MTQLQATRQRPVATPQTAKPTARRKGLRIGLVILGIVAVGAALGLAYIWFSGGSGAPSTATTAPSLVVDPGDPRTLLHITPAQSEVRFIIQEELLGRPKTVIGTTDQVAGDLLLDPDDPQSTQLGVIRINVRTLATDNEIRNRALRGQILQAERPENEFATFAPTALTGLPDQITLGTPVEFQITGLLTLRGIAREVTFDATVTPVSETLLEGSASTTVHYPDFGISIPAAPGVANVSEAVTLEIDFAASAAV